MQVPFCTLLKEKTAQCNIVDYNTFLHFSYKAHSITCVKVVLHGSKHRFLYYFHHLPAFYTLHPFFCVLTVTIHSTVNQHVLIIKHTPLQTWTPRKSVRPFFVLSRAPAMGAPTSEATLDILHDMPKRVPSRERSGVIFANAAEGTVTRAAEKKPRTERKRVSFFLVG